MYEHDDVNIICKFEEAHVANSAYLLPFYVSMQHIIKLGIYDCVMKFTSPLPAYNGERDNYFSDVINDTLEITATLFLITCSVLLQITHG